MFSRRQLLSILGALPAAGVFSPGKAYAQAASHFGHRLLGRTGRWVVPLGLGGQGSIQWTGANIDPADIVVRAVQLGINYLDTANAYGPSQMNFGEAFRRLRLVPDNPNYNHALRERLFLATKTTRRFSLERGSTAVTAVGELKRSLTQMFGDGKGHIPEGAYVDSIQIHNLTNMAQVDQVYEGMEERTASRSRDKIGALAGLLDYRDGTNYTGLNPEHRHYVRHIGITGHQSSPVLMSALQRDKGNHIDTLLVALNANDRQYQPHQHNVLPLAVARGVGVIAMKVFADGVFYGKEPGFSRTPEHVILGIGKPEAVSPVPLIRYPLALPGVACAITGIGQINRESEENDQLVVNLAAALTDLASEHELRQIEEELAARHGKKTNYFQDASRGLVQPTEVGTHKDGDRLIVKWNSALAGAEPVLSYSVFAGEKLLASLPYRPQVSQEPLSVTLDTAAVGDQPITVLASEAPPRRLPA